MTKDTQYFLRIINRQQHIISEMAQLEKELIGELSQYRNVELEEQRLKEYETLA